MLSRPGTDFNSGYVSIGGYLANGTKQSNLTVKNYTGTVGIGTSTPTSKLQANGTSTASSIVRSGSTSSQYLMADGSTSSLASSYTNTANMALSIFNNCHTFNLTKAGRGMIIAVPCDGPQNLLTFDIAITLPVNKLTGPGTLLNLKSNTISFDDEQRQYRYAGNALNCRSAQRY